MKRVVIILLSLLTGMLVQCARESSRGPETASMQLADSTSLLLTRAPKHAYLSEYRRVLELRLGDQPVARLSLGDDTGGYSRLNIYRSYDGRLIAKDVFGEYVIDVASRTIAVFDNKTLGVFLGAFDEKENGTLIFIPASDRDELPLRSSSQRRSLAEATPEVWPLLTCKPVPCIDEEK